MESRAAQEGASPLQQEQQPLQQGQQHHHHQHQRQYKPYYEHLTQQHHRHQQLQCRANQSKQQQEGKRGHIEDGLHLACEGKAMHSFCRQRSFADKLNGAATPVAKKKLFARSRSTPWSLDEKDQFSAAQESGVSTQQPESVAHSSSLLASTAGDEWSRVGVPSGARLRRLRSYGCLERITSITHTGTAQRNTSGFTRRYAPCPSNSAGSTIFASSRSGSSGLSKSSAFTNDYESSSPACSSSKGTNGSSHARAFFKKSVSFHCTPDLEPDSGACNSRRELGNAKSSLQGPAAQPDWKQTSQQVRAIKSHGPSTIKEARGSCAGEFRQRKPVLSPSAIGTPQVVYTGECPPAYSQRTPQHLQNQLHRCVSRRKQYQKLSQQQQVQQQQQQLHKQLSLEVMETAVALERTTANNLPFELDSAQQEMHREHPPLGQNRNVKHCPRPCYEMQCSPSRRLRPVALHDSQYQQHYRNQLQQQHSYKQQHQQKQDSEPKANQTTNCLSPAYYPLQPSASSPSLLRQQMQGGSLTLCEKDMNPCLDPLLQQLLLPAHDQLCVSSQQVYPSSIGSPSLLQQTLAGVPTTFVTDTRENLANHFGLARQNISPFSSFSAPQSSISFSASSLRSVGESSFCSNDISREDQQGTSLSTCVSTHTPPPVAASFELPPGVGSAAAASSLHYFAIPAPGVAGHFAAVRAKNGGYCVPSPQMSTYKRGLADNVQNKRQNDAFCMPKCPLLPPTKPSGTGVKPLIQGDNASGCTSASKTSVAETAAAAMSRVAPLGANLTCFTDHIAGSLADDATTASRSVDAPAAGNYASENDPEGDSKPAVSATVLAGLSCARLGRLPSDTGVAPAVSSSSKPVRGGETTAKYGRRHRQEGALKSSGGNILSVHGDATKYAERGDTVHHPFFFFFPPKDRSFLRPLGAPLVSDPRVRNNGGVDNKENDYVARKYEFIFPDYLLALSAPLVAPSEEVFTKQTSAAALLRPRPALSTPDPAASASTTVAVSVSTDCSQSAVNSAATRVLLNSAAQLDQQGNLRPAAVIQKGTGISDKPSATTQGCERDRRKEESHIPKKQPRWTQNRQPQPREEQVDRQSNTDVDDTGGKSELAKPSVAIAREHMSQDAVAQPTGRGIPFFRRKHAAADIANSVTACDEKGNIAVQRRMDQGLHNRAAYPRKEKLEVAGVGQEDRERAAPKGERKGKVAKGAAPHGQHLHMKQRGTGTCAEKPAAFLREKEQRQSQRRTLAAAALVGSRRRAKSLPVRKFPCLKDKGIIAAAGGKMGRKAPESRAGMAPVEATADYSAGERRVKRHPEDCDQNIGGGCWNGEEVLFDSALVHADQQKDDTQQAAMQTTEQPKEYLAAEGLVQLDLQTMQRTAYGPQRASLLSKMQAAREDKDDKAEDTGAEIDDAQVEQKEALLQQLFQRLEHIGTQGQEMHGGKGCGRQAAGCGSCSSPGNGPIIGDKSHENKANCWRKRNRSSMHYYQVLRLLGRGTFGHVYECLQFDACSGEVAAIVAVKVVKNDEAYTRSALQEIAILYQLNSKSDTNSRSTGEIPPAARANEEGNASSSSYCRAVSGKTSTVDSGSGDFDGCVQSGEDLPGQQLQHAKEEGQRKHGDGQQQKRGQGRQPDSDLGQKRVVQLLDDFTYRGHECLVFEILQTDLYQLMKKYRFSGFPLAAIKQVCRELLQGLAHLKRMRVVHCDLKPENILVRFSGPLPAHQPSRQDYTQKAPLLQRQQLPSPHQPQHQELHMRHQDCRCSAREFTRDTEEKGQQQRSVGVNFSRVIAPLRSVLPRGKAAAVSIPPAASNTPTSAESRRIRKKHVSTEVSCETRNSLADEGAPAGRTASVDIVPVTAIAATSISRDTTSAAAACLPLEACSTFPALIGSQLVARSKSHSVEGREYLSLPHTCKQTAACNTEGCLWLPSNSGSQSFTYSTSTGCSPPLFQNPPLTSSSVAVSWISPLATSPSAEGSHPSGADSAQTATDGPSLACKDAHAAAWKQQVACASACRTVPASLPDTGNTQTETRSVPTGCASPERSTRSATAQKAYLSISVKLIDFSSAYYLPSSPQPTNAAAIEVLRQRHARYPAAPYLYAQSRFYGAPEVMLGVHYMEKLDIWAVGCVAAELYSGKPLLPGTSDFDQMRRLVALRGIPPEWMLRLGRRTSSYFSRTVRLPQRRSGSDEDKEEKRRRWQQKREKEDKQQEKQGKQEVQMEQKQKQQEESVAMGQVGQDCKQAASEKMKEKGGREQECKKQHQFPLCEEDEGNRTPGVGNATQVSSLHSVGQGKSETAGPFVQRERWRALSAAPPGTSKRNIHAWWQRALVAVSSCSILEKKSMQDREGRRFGPQHQQQQAAGPPQQDQRSVCSAQQQQQKKQDQWTPLHAATGAHQQQPETGCHGNAAEGNHQLQHANKSQQEKEATTMPSMELRQQWFWGSDAGYRKQTIEDEKGRSDVPEVDRCVHKIELKAEPRGEDEPDDAKVEAHRNEEEEDTLWTASAEDEYTRGRDEKQKAFAEDNTCADEGRDYCGVERIEWRLKTAEAVGEEASSREDTPRESPILRSLQDLLIMRKQRDQLWRLQTEQQEATPRSIMRPLQLHCFGCWWPSTSGKEFGGKFATHVRQPRVLEAEVCTSQSQLSGDAKMCIISEAGMDARPALITEKGSHPLANQPFTSTNTPYPHSSILSMSAEEKRPAVEATRLMRSSSAKNAHPRVPRISEARLQCCRGRRVCTLPHADKSSYTLAVEGLGADSHHKGNCFFPNNHDSGEKEVAAVTVGIGQKDDTAATQAPEKSSNHDNTSSGNKTAGAHSLREPQLQQALSKGTGMQDMTRQPDTRPVDEKTTISSRAAVASSPSSVQPAVSSATSLVRSIYPATTSAVDSPSPAVLSASLSPGEAHSGDCVAACATFSFLASTSSSSRCHTETSQNARAATGSTLLPPVAAATPAQDPMTAAAPKTLTQAAANTRQSLPERATRFFRKLMKGRTSRPSSGNYLTLFAAENRSRASSSQRASSYEDDCPSLPKEKPLAAPDSVFTTPKSRATQKNESHGNVTLRTTPASSPALSSAATSFAPHIPPGALLVSSCAARKTPSPCSPMSPGPATAECLHSPKTDRPPPRASFPAENTDVSSHGCSVCSSADVTSPSSILPSAVGAPHPSPNASDIFSPPPVAFDSSSPRVLPVTALLSTQAAFPTLHGTAAAAVVSSSATGSSAALPPLKGMAACLSRSHCSCSVVCRIASSSFPPFPSHGASLHKLTSTVSTAGSTSACSCCSLQHMETAVGETAVIADPSGVTLQKQQEAEIFPRALPCPTLPDEPAQAALEEQAEEEKQEQLFLDFLDRLLQVDPFKRFSAEEALRHPFVAEDFIDSFEVAADLPAAAATLPGTAATKPTPGTAHAHSAESEAKAALGGKAVRQASAGKANAAAAAAIDGVAEPVVSAFKQKTDIILPREEHICPSVSELNTPTCSSLAAACFQAHVPAATASEATTHRPAEQPADFLSNPRLHGKPHEKESCVSINVVGASAGSARGGYVVYTLAAVSATATPAAVAVDAFPVVAAAAHAGAEVYSQRSRERAIDEQYSIWSSMRFKEVLQRLRDDPVALQPATPAAREQNAEAAEQQEEVESHNTAGQQGRSNQQTGADDQKEAAESGGVAAVRLTRPEVGPRPEKQDSSWATDSLCKVEGFNTTAATSSRHAVQKYFHALRAKPSQQKCMGAPPVMGERCAHAPPRDASRSNINRSFLPGSGIFSSRDFRPLKEAPGEAAVSAISTATAADNSGRQQSYRSRFASAEGERQLQDTLLLHHVQNVLEEEALKARHIREQRELQQRQLNELQELKQKRRQAPLTHQLRSTKRNIACGLRKTSTDA